MDTNDLKLDYLVSVTIKDYADGVLAQVVELNGDYIRFLLIGDNGGLEIDTTNPGLKWYPISLNFNHLKAFGFRHSHSNAYALKIGNNYMIAWIANFDSITGIDVFIDGKAKEKHQFTYLHEIQDEINNLNLIAIMDLNDHKRKLQDDFAIIDLRTSGKGLLLEVLLKRILPIEFRMEPDTHKTPHLHISYGKQKHAASYSLKSGERIVGELDSKYDKMVKIWIEKHKDSLLQIWNELQKGDQKGYEHLISAL